MYTVNVGIDDKYMTFSSREAMNISMDYKYHCHKKEG